MSDHANQLDPLGKLQEGPETTETPRVVGGRGRQAIDKDAVFTSEEATEFDRGHVSGFDNYGTAEWKKTDDKDSMRNTPSTDDYH